MLELREVPETIETVTSHQGASNVEGVRTYLQFYISIPTANGVATKELLLRGPMRRTLQQLKT